MKAKKDMMMTELFAALKRGPSLRSVEFKSPEQRAAERKEEEEREREKRDAERAAKWSTTSAPATPREPQKPMFYTIGADGKCAVIRADTKPDLAHINESDCQVVAAKAALSSMVNAFLPLDDQRRAILAYDKMWQKGGAIYKELSFIKDLDTARNLRTYDTIREHMKSGGGSYDETQSAKLEATKETIEKANETIVKPEDDIRKLEENWAKALDPISPENLAMVYKRIFGYNKPKNLQEIVNILCVVLGVPQFNGMPKTSTPPSPQREFSPPPPASRQSAVAAGPMVGSADLEKFKEELKEEFRSLAGTLKSNPLSDATVDRIEKNIGAIRSEMSDFRIASERIIRSEMTDILRQMMSDNTRIEELIRTKGQRVLSEVESRVVTLPESSVDTIRRITDDMAHSTTFEEFGAKLDRIESVISLREGNQAIVDVIAERTAKTLSQMSVCLASGRSMNPNGSCAFTAVAPPPLQPITTVVARERIRCEYVFPDGNRCKNSVGRSGDRSRRLCHAHA